MSLFRASLYLLFAAVVLGLGINATTGLTGKDEYLLGLRVPLEMMQGDHWWVPFLDGEPRLKKPPLLYWLGRASFEAFGPSLMAARAITVAFGLLLLSCTAWLGQQLTGQWRMGLLAAAVLLGMSGIASESRRFMLDVPVAALSVAAFCAYRSWTDRPRALALLGVAVCLCAALMIKGPFAVVACGGGVMALWMTRRHTLTLVRRHSLAHVVLFVLTLTLPAFWYFQVHDLYGAQLAQAAHDELEARQIGLSADAAIGIVTLALPWSFVAFHSLWIRRQDARVRFLGLWLLFTLVPFLFIRSFDRYLIGSLPALALLAALAMETKPGPPWTRRLGSLIPALLALTLVLLLWRWQLDGWPGLAIALLWFMFVWWRRSPRPTSVAIAAILLWAAGWGLAFPALDVNRVPQSVLDISRDKQVILFSGPQPALLPILEKRPLRQTSHLTLPVPRGTLIALRAEDRPALDKQLTTLGLRIQPRLEYRALTSAGSGIRFAKEGANRDDWRRAWDERSPMPLMSTMQVLEVLP